jgi:predicted alpha/beta superfamily hydrolase
MTSFRAAVCLLFFSLASVMLAGCGAIEPPPQVIPYASVTFEVKVPEDTPPGAIITVVGSSLTLGSDMAPGFGLRSQGGGRHVGLVRMMVGEDVSYDIWQRDTWIPEADATGARVARRTFRVEGDMTVSITVEHWGAPAAGPKPKRGLSGIIRTHPAVRSAFLAQPRDLIVYLPPDYFDSPERRYPVLYMHDGQNLMDASTSFSGEWSVDEAAEQLIQAGQVEPLIIVGVSNTSDRIAEYTQEPDPRYPAGGKADAYGRFLVEELKPMIDAKYRTRTGPGDTGLAGSSLGGLVSLYLGMKYPGTFSRLGVISPSVWWADRDILEHVRELGTKPPLKLWVDMGTMEDKDAIPDARLLREALIAKGWVEGSDLRYVEIEGAVHNEQAWSLRIDDVLRYLFPAR